MRTLAQMGCSRRGLVDITLIARLAETSPLPLNIMVDDATPSLSALAQHGVARVSYGPRPYLVAMKALEQADARGEPLASVFGPDGHNVETVCQ